MAATSNQHAGLAPAEELAKKRMPPFAGEREAYRGKDWYPKLSC